MRSRILLNVGFWSGLTPEEVRDVGRGLTFLQEHRDEVALFDDLFNEYSEQTRLYIRKFWSERATELQTRVKNSTDYILDICRAGGLIGEEAYREYRDGRKHYVPQRSWEKRGVSGLSVSDVLDRVASGSVFNPAVIEAKGRESLASNPLPFIANILQSSIFGMRANATKQKMLEWVERNYKELSDMGVVGLRRVYYVAKTDPISGELVRNDAGEVVYEMTTSAPSSEMLEKDAATRKSIKEVKKEIVKSIEIWDKEKCLWKSKWLSNSLCRKKSSAGRELLVILKQLVMT